MNDSLRMRLGAVLLALITLSAVVFAVLNFQQRSRFVLPDDGVTWMDSAQGVTAWHVVADSPAARAGIKQNDIVESVRAVPIQRATDVTRVLFRVGPWAEVHYQMRRGEAAFETRLVTAPQDNSSSIEDYLRITALLYLFIGLFIFVRRWNAPRAIHFYVFCLASFILYSFHYTGKLNSFDQTIYWANVVALLLQPALLVHFALVFPERRGTLWPKLTATYALPALLLTLHIFIAFGTLNFLPAFSTRYWLDKVEQANLGIYFLIAATIFLFSYRRAPSGVLRQQLKWVTGGTFAGSLPFLLFYIVPYVMGIVPAPWMKLSVFSLALIPLCFGYAIIRYRLMDVDIIFKRGLAYTFATAAVVGIYFAGIALIGETFHTRWPTGPAGQRV
jgi:two-component system NtrC family sensor kinase